VSSEGPSSVAALTDSQFGLFRVLLPYPNFEDDYQGTAGSTLVAFPGGRSPFVGQSGYDPNLAAALPVPVGARLCIGIPICQLPGYGIVVDYRYAFIYRDRNLGDFRRTGAQRARQPYHYGRQGLGALDTSGAVDRPLYPIQARFDTIAYEQPEPTASREARVDLYPEWIIPHEGLGSPLLPGGLQATIQQGIYDPQWVPDARRPKEAIMWRVAGGDDLIIVASKVPEEDGSFAAWDFSGPDLAFSNIYGRGGLNAAHPIYTDGGIRVAPGSNP
jgi:hypothetical protein